MSRAVRPIRVVGNMAYVPLACGLEAVIDAASVDRVRHWNWIAHKCKHTTYVVTSIAGKRVWMHRELVKPRAGLIVDHIDGNGLNNVMANLREATYCQNAQNRKREARARSGLAGAYWCGKRAQWYATIKVDGRSRRLGSFPSAEAAHEAYKKAAERFFGAFYVAGRPSG